MIPTIPSEHENELSNSAYDTIYPSNTKLSSTVFNIGAIQEEHPFSDDLAQTNIFSKIGMDNQVLKMAVEDQSLISTMKLKIDHYQ